MSRRGGSNKRKRHDVCGTFTHPSLQDLASGLEFLTGSIEVEDPLVSALLSNRLLNSSFWNWLENSDEATRTQLLVDERNKLKSDVNSKSKRLMLNRLIHACSARPNTIQLAVQQLIVKIKCQMSDSISSAEGVHTTSQLYDQVNALRQTQCARRLFYQESYPSCGMLTLQRLMTNQFINLLHFYRQNPHVQEAVRYSALVELLQHALVIVVQPCGSDCIAATKYEKVPNGFIAKLKTRIISLLDLTQTGDCLVLSNAEMALQSEEDDLHSDPQESLVYTTRTIVTNEKTQRTFTYAELKGTECLRLTKLNGNGKPSYNKGLCRLQFQTTFRVTVNGVIETIPIMCMSQWFGLCSHAKYYPKYLAKVFLAEVNQIHPDTNPEIHLHVLEEYIAAFHQRLTGVPMKVHTRSYVAERLQTYYQHCERYGSSPTTPVMFFSWSIHEDFLTKLFTQIRFLGNQLCLAVMYQDNLFSGITSEVDDTKLGNRTPCGIEILLRFEDFTQQKPTENPGIVMAKYDGTLSTFSIEHNQLLNDICRYCQSAQVDSLQIFADDASLPSSTFRWYYDNGVSRDSLIQTDNDTVFHPVDSLVQTTTQESSDQSSTGEQKILQRFRLSGQLTGKPDLIHRAIADLQSYFSSWCQRANASGTLSRISTDPMADMFDTNDLPFLNSPSFRDTLRQSLAEDHS